MRLKKWRASGSPTYDAAFTFGVLGLFLPPELEQHFRRRAGERPKFKKKNSWAHRTKARLETLQRGKPIPEAPKLRQLSETGFRFLCQCEAPFGRHKSMAWVKELRWHIR